MLLRGDCLELIRQMPDNSVDSIVTDPPYELGFMGKSWDNSGIAYSVALWTDCLRVLKPGGHLLAFGGSRTYHRLACAIEDAGFEVRDQIMWLYGSGFPKSLDVSKAIDKRGGANIGWFGSWLKNEREKRGISRKELAQHFPSQQQYGGKPASGNTTGCVGNWETGVSVPTNEQFNELCKILDLPFSKLEEAEREVIKERTMVQGGGNSLQMRVGERREVEANITAPATPAAQQWQGWGTALKPAHEPIVVARKPLVGTVANNVLEWGTGALNIDGSRVGYGDGEVNFDRVQRQQHSEGAVEGAFGASALIGKEIATYKQEGRWPANVIHDGSDEVLAGFPDSNGGAFPQKSNVPTGRHYEGGWGAVNNGVRTEMGSGSAARFFYCAKASKSERNAGLEGLPKQSAGVGDTRPSGDFNQRLGTNDKPAQPVANIHPTVKPIALMRYLVKLVTPPGGTVLDPFLGSGTTACAAIMEGFEWLGCEMTEDYWPIIEARVAWAESERIKASEAQDPQASLF